MFFYYKTGIKGIERKQKKEKNKTIHFSILENQALF